MTQQQRSSKQTDTETPDDLSLVSGLPYPWTNRDGIIKLLEPENLWAGVLANYHARKPIRAAAKGLGAKGNLDDAQLLGYFCKLLASRSGRAELFRELQKYRVDAPERYVAGKLALSLSRHLPPTVLKGVGVQKTFLDLSAFKRWTSNPDYNSWSKDELLLATAVYAISQPSQAQQLASLLVHRDDIRIQFERESLVKRTSASATTQPLAHSLERLPEVQPPDFHPIKPVAHVDDRLSELRTLLSRIILTNQATQIALSNGDLERVVESNKIALDLRGSLRSAYSRLLSREDVPIGTLPADIPTSAIAIGTAAMSWISDLERHLQATHEYTRSVVRAHRDDFVAELTRLSLQVPADLDKALRLEDIAAIRERERPKIILESAWLGLLQRREYPGVTLPISARVALLSRLVKQGILPEIVLSAFIDDRDIRPTLPIEHVMIAVTQHLAAGGTLPDHLWRALFKRCGSVFCGVLDAHSIAAAIAELPDSRVAGSELFELLATQNMSKGGFTAWFEERRIQALPAEEQILPLAALVQNAKTSQWLELLIGALSAAGRHSEAVLLSTLGMRTSRLRTAEDVLPDAMLHALLDAVADSSRHHLARLLISTPHALISGPESLIIVAYASVVIEPSLFELILYRDESAFEHATKRYPHLLTAWLINVRGPLKSRESMAIAEHEHAAIRQEYADWQRALEKRSSYSGWDIAIEYQRRINEWLKSQFYQLCSVGDYKHDREPSDIVDDIGAQHRLFVVEGNARKGMMKLLETQIERLSRFREFARSHHIRSGLEELLRSTRRSLHDELSDESSRVFGPLRRVYQEALREQAP